MEVNTIIQMISTVGFPIVMCVVMFLYLTKQEERHKEEISKMTEALNNNTIALTRLELKIGDDEGGKS